jgi:hypothetical protein
MSHSFILATHKIYIIHRFVSKPKGKKTLKKSITNTNPQQQNNNAQDQAVENILHASLRTQANAVSSLNTPYNSTPDGISSSHPQDTSAALKAATATLISNSRTEETDGAILHTIAISECCFKIGRITVPPALAIAANGFSAPPSEFGSSSSSLTEYSKKNPPPHWEKAKAVMSVPCGGSTKKLKELFVSGWRDVPEEERWWERALGGVVERRRKERLEAVACLRSGMEGAKGLG